ncbi:MAG TPA: putative toxin-antitoxin system toxin component, PIN family [Thermoanaerobaculia bacterium]|jgi:putative PIN family toxin of toxin-antitoxin system|nr:putative toxin-antitoxin system toxin component, PIN family [Thermoanaerobaculia bacterium]
MRAVIDTNILVRAMLNPDGSVGPVVDLLRDGHYLFLYSEETLNELIDVLSRPRMVHRYGLTAAEVDALCALVIRRGETVQSSRTIMVCRDPKDNKFLEVAAAGRADVIVTGDDDLKVLDPFEGIPIIKPFEFLRALRQSLEPKR